MKKIVIYTNHKTNRLEYVLDHIFQSYISIELELIAVSGPTSGIKDLITINYSSLSIEHSLKMPIASCLEDGYDINSFDDFERDLKYLNGSFSFDMFSAIFFLLSRAEEYNNSDPDQHGRFKSKNSILSTKQMLFEPVVDYWMISFRKIINDYYNIDLQIDHTYTFNSTLDIDHFFAYKHKSLAITLGSFFRDLSQLKFKNVATRFLSKDPYDTFDDIFEFHKSLDLKLMLFVLCSRRSRFDKSLPPENKEFIYRIQQYSEKHTLGIHPSYRAGRNEEQLDIEIKLLESILSNEIKDSRQHYILLDFPQTYRALIKAGISNDYSLGYPETIGFRAGTSRPFKWYDLDQDECTPLVVHPFQIMDVSLKNYMELNPLQALDTAKEIINRIKEVNGECTIIWHNSSFSELHGWENWNQVYFDILTAGKP